MYTFRNKSSVFTLEIREGQTCDASYALGVLFEHSAKKTVH